MWPWRRRPPAGDTGAPPAGPATPAPPAAAEPGGPAGGPPGWSALPPIQRVTSTPTLLTGPQQFTASLAAWRDPSYLGPLGHAVSAAEPAGVLHDVAVAVPGSTGADGGADLPVVGASAARAAAVQRYAGPVGAPPGGTATGTASQPGPPAVALQPLPAAGSLARTAPSPALDLPVLDLPVVSTGPAGAPPPVQRVAAAATPPAVQAGSAPAAAPAEAPPATAHDPAPDGSVPDGSVPDGSVPDGSGWTQPAIEDTGSATAVPTLGRVDADPAGPSAQAVPGAGTPDPRPLDLPVSRVAADLPVSRLGPDPTAGHSAAPLPAKHVDAPPAVGRPTPDGGSGADAAAVVQRHSGGPSTRRRLGLGEPIVPPTLPSDAGGTGYSSVPAPGWRAVRAPMEFPTPPDLVLPVPPARGDADTVQRLPAAGPGASTGPAPAPPTAGVDGPPAGSGAGAPATSGVGAASAGSPDPASAASAAGVPPPGGGDPAPLLGDDVTVSRLVGPGVPATDPAAGPAAAGHLPPAGDGALPLARELPPSTAAAAVTVQTSRDGAAAPAQSADVPEWASQPTSAEAPTGSPDPPTAGSVSESTAPLLGAASAPWSATDTAPGGPGDGPGGAAATGAAGGPQLPLSRAVDASTGGPPSGPAPIGQPASVSPSGQPPALVVARLLGERPVPAALPVAAAGGAPAARAGSPDAAGGAGSRRDGSGAAATTVQRVQWEPAPDWPAGPAAAGLPETDLRPEPGQLPLAPDGAAAGSAVGSATAGWGGAAAPLPGRDRGAPTVQLLPAATAPAGPPMSVGAGWADPPVMAAGGGPRWSDYRAGAATVPSVQRMADRRSAYHGESSGAAGALPVVPAPVSAPTVGAELLPADTLVQRVVVQRVESVATPPPDPTPAPDPAPPPAPAPAPAPAAVAVAAPAAGPAAEPEELLRKLFDPLLRRLRTELRLDRERYGERH